jgi:hypothetical protein
MPGANVPPAISGFSPAGKHEFSVNDCNVEIISSQRLRAALARHKQPFRVRAKQFIDLLTGNF